MITTPKNASGEFAWRIVVDPDGRNSGKCRAGALISQERAFGAYTFVMVSGKNNVIDLTRRKHSNRQQLIERLFNEHGDALCLFFRGRLVPADEIEDMVQELFSRLIGVSGLESKMSASTGSNRAFLLTMANNMLVDIQRRQAVRRDYHMQQQNVEANKVNEITPEVIVAAHRDLDAVKSVIMGLRPTWRKAFVLNRFKMMSYREIAEHMDVTVKQVESYIAQAMSRLRKAERLLKKVEKGREKEN